MENPYTLTPTQKANNRVSVGSKCDMSTLSTQNLSPSVWTFPKSKAQNLAQKTTGMKPESEPESVNRLTAFLSR